MMVVGKNLNSQVASSEYLSNPSAEGRVLLLLTLIMITFIRPQFTQTVHAYRQQRMSSPHSDVSHYAPIKIYGAGGNWGYNHCALAH